MSSAKRHYNQTDLTTKVMCVVFWTFIANLWCKLIVAFVCGTLIHDWGLVLLPCLGRRSLFSCHHKIFTMILVVNEMLQRLPMVSILCRKGGKQKQTAAMLKLNVERPVFSWQLPKYCDYDHYIHFNLRLTTWRKELNNIMIITKSIQQQLGLL